MKQKDLQDAAKRAALGKLSGLVGIVCNVGLAGSKLAVGKLAGSMSITADGLNNLSDAASSIVTLTGFKLAEKPADKEHPYGHARFEYLASLTVSVMILFIGFELAKSSVEKVLHPVAVEFSLLSMIVLIASILVKAGMMIFNTRMGKRIDSTVLIATAADSRNDVLTTTAVLIAALIEHATGWKVDGIMGILVSVFILWSGIGLARDTISPLLGEGVKSDFRKELTEAIMTYPMVLGCHDLMVHDYGPGKRYASIHVEFDKDDNLNIELSGKDMGVLIGKRGQTLDSIQYLTSLVVNKGNAGYVRVKVDTENYRARRKETLENLAKNIAFKVKRTKKPVFLEPMNPYERRVIHSALQNDPLVSTHSEGEEPYRKVVVTLKKQ